MKFLLAILPFILSNSYSYAQTTNTIERIETRCFLANLAFTEGATIQASNQVMVCTANGIWENTNLWAAGCLRGGKLYATGAVENVTSNAAVNIKCQENGTWETLEISP
jgi:hypothetical protein